MSSYFVKTIEHPKTQALVARIYDIETLVTRSETEALLLEQNLIKQHRPPYNIMLRDDKSYVYILFLLINLILGLPVGVVKVSTKLVSFWPVPSAYSARDTLLVLQKLLMCVSAKIVIFHSASVHVCNTRSSGVQLRA